MKNLVKYYSKILTTETISKIVEDSDITRASVSFKKENYIVSGLSLENFCKRTTVFANVV